MRHALRTWSAAWCCLPAVLLCACASVSARNVRFDEALYAPYAGKGTGTITAEVDLTPLSLGRETNVRCEEAILTPVTPYSTEWVERELLKGERLTDADPRIQPYQQIRTLGGGNHVHFYNLPAGSYYVACRMTSSRWFMGRHSLTMFGQRGWTYAKAEVASGEHVVVILQNPLTSHGDGDGR